MGLTGTDLDARLARAAEQFGTPSFVYFESLIAQRADRLKTAFGARFDLSFAVKCNPNPALLEWLRPHVEMLDVSSIGEFRLALRAGWSPAKISFTGPAKRDAELKEAIAGGVGELVLESPREARAADRIARALGVVQPVLIRVAPTVVPKGFGDQMAGRPSAFGIDEEELDTELPRIQALANLRVVGIHIYSGTQCLKPEAICENYRIFIGLFRSICERHAIEPVRLIFGSGLGIPYHDGDVELDLDQVARGIVDELDALKREARFRDTALVLELGRYLVGQAGYFLTRVVSVKRSRGSKIAICDGGMNNHLPASGHFGMVIHRNYAMHKVGGQGAPEKLDLVGPLCTSIDKLGRGVTLPALEEGDLVAVHNSGAYGPTASPVHFISHAQPREILAGPETMRDVTRALGDL